MAVSKAQQKAVNKYVRENYDRVNVTMPKGSKEYLQTVVAENGESVNAYIVGAVNDRLKAEGRSELPAKPTSEQEQEE